MSCVSFDQECSCVGYTEVRAPPVILVWCVSFADECIAIGDWAAIVLLIIRQQSMNHQIRLEFYGESNYGPIQANKEGLNRLECIKIEEVTLVVPYQCTMAEVLF